MGSCGSPNDASGAHHYPRLFGIYPYVIRRIFLCSLNLAALETTRYSCRLDLHSHLLPAVGLDDTDAVAVEERAGFVSDLVAGLEQGGLAGVDA